MSYRRRIILILIVVSTLAFFLYDRSRTRRKGPESPTGYSVVIECKDAGFGPGADYYADVRIKDPSGEEIAQWKDTNGQKSIDGLDRLIDSMEWTSANSLSFTSHPNQHIRLSVHVEP